MNKNTVTGIKKALAMLDCGDPVEAVSALNIVERQALDLNTRKLVEKAKDEASIGAPEEAEYLLGLIDLRLGEVVISRDGISKGKTTGGERQCTMEGCRGNRVGVRWPDGKLTFPCTHGMNWDEHESAWKLI